MTARRSTQTTMPMAARNATPMARGVTMASRESDDTGGAMVPSWAGGQAGVAGLEPYPAWGALFISLVVGEARDRAVEQIVEPFRVFQHHEMAHAVHERDVHAVLAQGVE